MANKKKKAKLPVKKSAPKKKVAKKTVSKKAVAKKTVAKKTVAKKSVAKKTAPQKKTAVKKSPAKKTVKAAPKKTTHTVNIAPLQAKVIDYSKAITPLSDRLVVRVLQGERVTAGGLIIPDTVSMMATGYLKAEVLAVGHGAKNKKGNIRPLDVQIGDQVLFAQHAGTKIEFNAEELQIIHESDVMGILQNPI